MSSPTSSPKRDYIRKLEHARNNLFNLDEFVNRWCKPHSEAAAIAFEPDPKDPNYSLLKMSITDPSPDSIPLLIGDIVYNLRSSLDYLAFELARAYTKPLTQEIAEGSQFPIFGDVNSKGISGSGPALFNRFREKYIGGINPSAQAVIETLQPYQDGLAWKDNPLWWLHVLNNIDKHRMLTVMLVRASSVTMEYPIDWNIGHSDIEWLTGPIERNTVIARIRVSLSEKSTVGVNIRPSVSVGFTEQPVSERVAVRTLEEIVWHIEDRVFRPLADFL